jgi:hypothetical protein
MKFLNFCQSAKIIPKKKQKNTDQIQSISLYATTTQLCSFQASSSHSRTHENNGSNSKSLVLSSPLWVL